MKSGLKSPFQPRRWPPRPRPMPAWAGGPRRHSIWRNLVYAAVLVGAGALAWYLNGNEPVLPIGAPITGEAEKVVDGDTLDLAGQRIRLAGMDAPEHDQPCTDATGKPWACGAEAGRRLRALVAGQTLSCTPVDHDRYGRTVAVCLAGETDLGRRLVGEGFAISTDRYGAEEAKARESRSGIFQGAFIRPAVWRQTHGKSVDEAGRSSRFDRFVAWLGSWFGS